MRWFVRGDVDGFFGLALDNLVQLMLIAGLCQGVLGFPAELVYGRILPGAAVSLLVGNLFYAWQARRLAAATGRGDICALPYGINTVSLFAHVFLVMLPATFAAKARGLDAAAAATVAWQAGLLACLGSGLIELLGATVAERIRKASPRAALLSTLAGIALGFISFSFLFRTFAFPVVGLATLGVILLTYFGRVRFRGGLPGGLVAVALGTALAWGTGLVDPAKAPTGSLALHLPVPVLGDLLAAFSADQLLAYLAVIIPMGVFNVIGSLQNIESAEAAGDRYPTAPSLSVNGLGSVAAALFGSCFPTTIYIGHPGWKALGARAGYSVLNGAFCTVVCLTGSMAWIAWAVPIEAGMAIVLWIGIVITAQAFQATPREHAPAVVLGLLPGIGAWGVLMAKDGLRAAGATFSPELIPAFLNGGSFIAGAFALEQGFIFTAMVFAAVTVHLIERRFVPAAAWCLGAAALSALGFMHSYVFTPADVVGALGHPAWPWAIGYLAMAATFLAARWLTEPDVEHL
jgi:AGZA family xanthine/uracil permease-like MFS transporter